MLINVDYGIIGKPELRVELSKYLESDDFIAILCPLIVWTIQRADLSLIMRYEVERIKLMFLAYLHHDFLLHGDSNDKFIHVLKSLLGEPPYSLETFDKWWEISEFYDSQNFERIQEEVPITILEMLQKTGIEVVDNWFKRLIATKKSGQ